jgi:hypothetical protein
MANTALLTIKILADAKDAIKGLDATASSADKFKGGIDKLTGPRWVWWVPLALLASKPLTLPQNCSSQWVALMLCLARLLTQLKALPLPQLRLWGWQNRNMPTWPLSLAHS